MDYLDELGKLALGSRLKRLSERLGQEVWEVYKAQGIEFEPRWFPIFHYLGEQETAAITDIAQAVSVTHPAVNQIAQELADAGLIISISDPEDRRRRLLSLSKKGLQLKVQLESTWKILHAALSDTNEETTIDLVNALSAFEKALDKRRLTERFDELSVALQQSKPEILEFAPDLASHFFRLNRTWIEKYFYLEEADYQVLGNPQKIIKDGGAIFFVRLGQKIVGTCALVKLDKDTFEIAKMAVDEAYQGQGLGRLLLEKCLKRAGELMASVITLETNTRLASAVRLYQKAGFKKVEGAGAHPSAYQRVNLVMEREIKRGHRSRSSAKERQRLGAL